MILTRRKKSAKVYPVKMCEGPVAQTTGPFSLRSFMLRARASPFTVPLLAIGKVTMEKTIAIIDADLIGRKRHRFPNLAAMKISSYYKGKGCMVELKTDYLGLEAYDRVFIAKVFTDTKIDQSVLVLPNVVFGGTGFFYDKAPHLPEEIEHCMPDYHLYDTWVEEQIQKGGHRSNYSFYLDYSIGFLTRGCFRQCAFCVNRSYKSVALHSPLAEFYDPSRKKICLLDDNFFGCPSWKEMLLELQSTGKPFRFMQGLDERLLTDEKCQMLFASKYDGDFIFAFDNLADRELIEKKICLARKYTDAQLKFYCFTGFDREDKWDDAFWKDDIFSLFARIEILMKHKCIPYVMRYARYKESPYRGMYITIARWCNQPSMFKKKSLREYQFVKGNSKSVGRYLREFEEHFPEACYFYDLHF